MTPVSDWSVAARSLLTGANRVLLVGVKNFGLSSVSSIRDPFERLAVEQQFEAIVWHVRGGLAPGLRALRAKLSTSAVLLLIVERPGVLELLSRALRPAAARISSPGLLEACEALLLVGLELPTLVAQNRRGLVLSARKPEQLGPLDVFFEQPSH